MGGKPVELAHERFELAQVLSDLLDMCGQAADSPRIFLGHGTVVAHDEALRKAALRCADGVRIFLLNSHVPNLFPRRLSRLSLRCHRRRRRSVGPKAAAGYVDVVADILDADIRGSAFVGDAFRLRQVRTSDGAAPPLCGIRGADAARPESFLLPESHVFLVLSRNTLLTLRTPVPFWLRSACSIFVITVRGMAELGCGISLIAMMLRSL